MTLAELAEQVDHTEDALIRAILDQECPALTDALLKARMAQVRWYKAAHDQGYFSRLAAPRELAS